MAQKILFKQIHQEYLNKQIDKDFNLYLIELFSIFDSKALKQKSKYLEPLMKDMQKA